MGPFEIAFGKVVIITAFVARTWLTAYRLRLRYRPRPSLEMEREVELLREEAELQRARLEELEERVDFAERRLVQPREDRPRLDPPVITPV